MLTNELFEKVFCINLRHRTDRRKESEAEFKKHHIQVQFFDAINGKFLVNDNGVSKGNLGCIYSHRNIIVLAKQLQLKNILIFEDDVEFSDDYNQKIILAKDFGANVLYLGGSDKYASVEKINENFSLIKGSLCTHAYAITEKMYDIFIHALSDPKEPIDVIYSKLSNEYEFYGYRPKIAWQRESYSDILERKIKYKSCTNEPNPQNEW